MKAAEQGDTVAQHNLGFLYERGLGVSLDYVEAFKWFDVSAAHGRNESQKELQTLKQIMTTSQTRRAEEQVRAWEQAHAAVEPTSAFANAGIPDANNEARSH